MSFIWSGVMLEQFGPNVRVIVGVELIDECGRLLWVIFGTGLTGRFCGGLPSGFSGSRRRLDCGLTFAAALVRS